MKALEPITGVDGILIFPPIAKEKLKAGSGEAKYLGPLPMLAVCSTPEIFAKLTRHHLLVKDRKLAVHVFRLSDGKLSWTMGHFKCRSSKRGSEALAIMFKTAAGVAIMAPGPLRNSVVRMTQHDRTKTADQRVYEFICTLDVVYRDSDTEPIWVLYARPCTEFVEQWEPFRSLVRDTTFGEGFAEFSPIGSAPRHLTHNGVPGPRPLALCYICKLDDHRTATCPYRTLLDWQGPNNVITDELFGVVKASGRSLPAHGRGQLRSRGGRR
ncbi:hypothetical protein C8F04DRAFT_1119546 [Mycena alexandri]|uniref:Uncharacterized protein n=1 Tax=Mycena alexandri TaxID=1745969 RepID=A0AAD6SJC2_9AGAR|nr:hypothetical protein C8F04DRAFT_1119546 [Mycena alexandri]